MPFGRPPHLWSKTMISSKTAKQFEKFVKKPKKKGMDGKEYNKLSEMGRGYEAVVMAKKGKK